MSEGSWSRPTELSSRAMEGHRASRESRLGLEALRLQRVPELTWFRRQKHRSRGPNCLWMAEVTADRSTSGGS